MGPIGGCDGGRHKEEGRQAGIVEAWIQSIHNEGRKEGRKEKPK